MSGMVWALKVEMTLSPEPGLAEAAAQGTQGTSFILFLSVLKSKRVSD